MNRALFVCFDFNGRIKRTTWIVYTVMLALAQTIAEYALRHGISPAEPRSFLAAYLGDSTSLLVTAIFLWPSLAIDVKRWHDLGRSGWYAFLMYGPFAFFSALMEAGYGGTVDRADPAVARLMAVFGVIILVYVIVMAARKGNGAANRFGDAPS